MSQTFLTLAQHQGGQRFGPFAGGTIQIGAHPTQCQIAITSQGVAPVHCQVVDNNNGQYTITPVERGLGLWIIQAGDTQMWPIQAPVLGKPGDTVVVGSENGPRLTIEANDAAPAKAAGWGGGPAAGGSYGKGGFAGAMSNEMSRQAHAKMMHRNRWYRDAYNTWYRLRTGSLTNPRVLVGLFGTIVTVLGFLFMSCAGGLLTLLQLLTGG